MNRKKTALILIGYQNDYFAEDGILRNVIKESEKTTRALTNTTHLLKRLNDVLIISTPIIFSPDYKELVEPIGILETIKNVGAFRKGEKGSETIAEIKQFDNKIIEIEGKQGLNAFINTDLEKTLADNDIIDVAFAGAVCSICIDSTGRSAHEKGFKVTMLSDCISGRTVFEQEFYCENVFPLYASISTSQDFLKEIS